MPQASTDLSSPSPGGEDALERFQRRMLSPWQMRLFMLAKLPLAFIAGLRITAIDRQRCTVAIRYGWRTTNPFRSMYFAAQSMAAELSTGALSMLAVEVVPREAAAAGERPSVAMLITGLEASFGKKAVGLVTFTCEAGPAIFAAVQETLVSGEAVTVRAETVGRMNDGTEVSRFVFNWSFRQRSRA